MSETQPQPARSHDRRAGRAVRPDGHDPRAGARDGVARPLYLKVWAGLAIFTAIEYFYAHIFKDLFFFLILGLMVWAVIKARWSAGTSCT